MGRTTARTLFTSRRSKPRITSPPIRPVPPVTRTFESLFSISHHILWALITASYQDGRQFAITPTRFGGHPPRIPHARGGSACHTTAPPLPRPSGDIERRLEPVLPL